MTAERIGAIAACALVAGGLVAGFTVIGPPQHARAEALDRRRVQDLALIAERMRDAHAHRRATTKPLPARLPKDLYALRFDGSDATADPANREPYRYVRVDAQHFRLCATFSEPDDAVPSYDLGPHPAGRACYRFDIAGPPNVMGRAVPEERASADRSALHGHDDEHR